MVNYKSSSVNPPLGEVKKSQLVNLIYLVLSCALFVLVGLLGYYFLKIKIINEFWAEILFVVLIGLFIFPLQYFSNNSRCRIYVKLPLSLVIVAFAVISLMALPGDIAMMLFVIFVVMLGLFWTPWWNRWI